MSYKWQMVLGSKDSCGVETEMYRIKARFVQVSGMGHITDY